MYIQQQQLPVWVLLSQGLGDPDVSSLTSTDISACIEADSKRPTEKNFVKTFEKDGLERENHVYRKVAGGGYHTLSAIDK